MILYRITKAAYARDLSGTGARMYGARWNQKGSAVLYTASSPALATVELLVHVDANLLPTELRLVFVEVLDTASSRTVQSLRRSAKLTHVCSPRMVPARNTI